jgi:hypothetical protein
MPMLLSRRMTRYMMRKKDNCMDRMKHDNGWWLAGGISDLRPRILPPSQADLLPSRGPVPDGVDSGW